VQSWETSTNRNKLFAKQGNKQFSSGGGSNSVKISINSTKYQTIDGFGWCMTEGSALWISELSESARRELLTDLFSVENGIGSAAVRVPIGASDLSEYGYTYQDNRNSAFSLDGPDGTYLVPVLRQIVEINPNVKFIGSPWSAPAWMKTNNNLHGGSLSSSNFDAYADYFINYFKAMKAQNINFYAVTIQNEPLHDGNTPSMYMSKEDQYNFVEKNLGPKLRSSDYKNVKLIGWDHNCDNTEYPIYVARSEYIEGSAFHLYSGTIDALSKTYEATGKSVYFTEQYTASDGDFGGDFSWHLQNVMIGTVNNWGKVAFEWNAGSNEKWEPHTDNGGCGVCKGAFTINSNSKAVTKNVAYYTVAHMSKVTRTNAVRIGSSSSNGNLHHSAFSNPDGTTSVVVFNSGSSAITFDIQHNGNHVSYTLDGNTAASIIWE
jgi:glucosylceramidase